MKRTLSFILAVAMLLSLTILPTNAAWSEDGSDKPTVEVSVEGKDGADISALLPGQKVGVTVSVKNVPTSWSSYQIQLNYDSNSFTPTLDKSGKIPSSNYSNIKSLFGKPTANNDTGKLILTGAVDELSEDDYERYVQNDGLIDIDILSSEFTVRDGAKGSATFSLETQSGTAQYQLGFTASSGLAIVNNSPNDVKSVTTTILETNSISVTPSTLPNVTTTTTIEQIKNMLSVIYIDTTGKSNQLKQNEYKLYSAQTEGTEYSDSDTLNAGQTTVYVGYGTAERVAVSITVGKTAISPAVTMQGWTYGSSANTPQVTGNLGNAQVTYQYKQKGANDSTYTNDVPSAVGEYTVKATIAETDKYASGSATAHFTIAPNTDALTVTLPTEGNYVYNGTEQTPAVTVKSGTTTLNAESDYTVQYTDNKNAGTATVTVTGKGNYAGATGTATFQIARKTIAESDFSKLPVDTKGYTGHGITQNITTTLTSNDYKAEYSNNVNAGTAKYTITGLGNYTGSFEKTFTISKANWSKSITGSVNLYYRSTTKGSFEVGSLVNAPAGAAFTGQVTIPGNSILAVNSVNLNNGKLVYTPTGTQSSGQSVVVQVPVSSTNYNDATASITFTTVDINIPWPEQNNLTIKENPVYGDTNADILNSFPTGTVTATAAGNVTGKFSVKNAAEHPAAGTTSVTLVFTPDADQSITTPFEHQYTITAVAKKSVTINGVTAQGKVYDGNTSATPDNSKATISGKLDGDDLTVTAGTASFADKNAGTNKTVTFIGYALSGDAAGNYELSGQPAPVKANITQKELTVTAGNLNFTKVYDGTTSVGTKSGNLELTDVISGDTVSVADGYTAAYADANVGTNKNVEVTGLTLTGTDAGNYKLKSTTLTVPDNSITKATWDKTTATSSAKYGTTGTLDLSQYLVSDAEVGTIATTDANSVLDGTPSVAKNVLTYKFKNDANLKDKTATITVPVTSGNYENYSITVTVTVLDKLTQDNFKFAEATLNKSYGDSKFTYAATGAVDGSNVTYSSSNQSVATVDAKTGEVTILKAGETTITAAATATDEYAAATKSYTLTVSKAKLTVRPKSYTIRVGDTLPTPEVEYVGLKNNDKAENVAKLNGDKKLDLKIKNKDNGTLENSNTTGTYEIVFEETPAFQTAENYEIEVVATGTLTINSRSSSSSGGSGVSTYPVSVTTPKNGKVSVDPRNAAKGAAVTVTVTPDSGYEMDKLTVTDASGKTISTTDKGNGKFTFTMPNGKVSVSATFKQTTVTPPSTGFVDVPASAYYADAVKWAVEKGITTGTSATTFSPEASCTRAQMVTFLWRAAGSPAPKATTTAFTDLDKSAYYYDAVLWAVEQGITTGTSATTFSPNATVTRGQTVTFLYRFAGQPAVSGSSSFTDVNSSDYYAAAVQWAKEQGITSGTSDTTFSPTNDCTRGQIVTFLYRQLAK